MNEITIVTHSGNFHADDVFAVATLELFFEQGDAPEKNIRIIRTRDKEIIASATCVVDVGAVYNPSEKRFDHHQEGGAGARDNGIPYASFGLVWKEYGEQVTRSKVVADMLDKKLVSPIDANDNGVAVAEPRFEGVKPYTINDIVFSFYPTWKHDIDTILKEEDQAFRKLVAFAKELLEREIIAARAIEEAKDLVEVAYEASSDKKIIVLEQEYPRDALDVLQKYPEPLFVVRPVAGSTHWKVNTVRKSDITFESRKDLPQVWAGKRDADLEAVTGVAGSLFCHNKLFMCVASTKDAAHALANKAING